MFVTLEKYFGDYVAMLRDRIRAARWRIRGAELGVKSRIGQDCRIVRQWCFITGDRIQLEHQVFIKIISDDAEIKIGQEVFIGNGVELDISERLTLGNHVLISPGCFITDHQHKYGAHDLIAAQGCESAPVIF